MKLIVGLGNPGQAYVNSRHNLGFQCVNAFARKHGIVLTTHRVKARIGIGQVDSQKVVLAKPRTFMNLSGEPVSSLVRYYRIALSDLLVIYDDIDFPLGKFRIRQGGSAGGHNGVQSIIEHQKSQDFPRIRVGIGQVPPEESSVPSINMRTPEYVLGRFTSKEKPIVSEVCSRVAEAIYCVLSEGIVTAMNRYNFG